MFVEAWPRGIKISGQAALFISLSKDDLLCTAVTAVSWGMCVHLGVPSQSPTLVIPALGRLRQRDCLKHQVNQDCITRFCQKKKAATPGMVAHTFNPALEIGWQVDLSLKPAWSAQ